MYSTPREQYKIYTSTGRLLHSLALGLKNLLDFVCQNKRQ